VQKIVCTNLLFLFHDANRIVMTPTYVTYAQLQYCCGAGPLGAARKCIILVDEEIEP
jgi:hypothetical protein